MSDQPLFQKADEQEAIYAPQQAPSDHPSKQAADIEDGGRDTETTTDEIGVPAAGAGLLGQTGGGISTGTVGGGPSALGPAVSSSAPEDETAGDRPV
jgi:hypothetical protein